MKIVIPLILDPVLMRSNPLVQFLCDTYNQRYRDSIMRTYPFRDQLQVQKSLQKQPAIVYQKDSVPEIPREELELRVQSLKACLKENLERVYQELISDKTNRDR